MLVNLMKKGLFTGIGLGIMAKDRVEQLAEAIREEAQLSEEQGQRLMDEMMEQSEEARSNFQKQVEGTVQKTLDKLDIPTRCQLKELKERVEKLEQLVAHLEAEDRESS